MRRFVTTLGRRRVAGDVDGERAQVVQAVGDAPSWRARTRTARRVATQPSVHVEPPAGRCWKRTDAMPDPTSDAPPETVTVPRSGDPGSAIVTALGATPSAVTAAVSALSKLSIGTPPAPATTERTT